MTRTGVAAARSRLAVGGRIALHVPFAAGAIDPHRLDDPLAAIFGGALFDALYTHVPGGAAVPALAEDEPQPDGDGVVVTLRREIVTAAGRPIDARDAAHSLARARLHGARAWLAEIPTPERRGQSALRFATRDGAKVMQVLASPLTAIVPLAFDPERPDGTGAFAAERSDDGFVFVRNARAARGPALLDAITLRAAPDLATSLRAFEAGSDDLGWLGAGLHAPRAGARSFDAGAVAWIVLRVGRDAGSWDAPGVAQRVLDGLPPAKLSYLGLGPPWRQERDDGWRGPAGELLVPSEAPYLVEVASTVAALLSRPGHELTVKPLAAREFQARRARRDHLLALDVARPLGPGALAAWLSIASLDDAAATTEAARRPLRVPEVPARALGRTLTVGVLGELHVQGARIPELVLPPSADGGWDLAMASRGRRPT